MNLNEVNKMSDVIDVNEAVEAKKEFTIEIKISDANLQYKSDFNEAETVFWMESVKTLILNNAFARSQQSGQ
jgi:hypothetical protein